MSQFEDIILPGGGSTATNPCGGNIDDLELVVLVNWDTCTLPRHTLREGFPRQTRICPFICQSKRDRNEWVRGLKDLPAKYYIFPYIYICMILTSFARQVTYMLTLCESEFSAPQTCWLSSHSSNNCTFTFLDFLHLRKRRWEWGHIIWLVVWYLLVGT